MLKRVFDDEEAEIYAPNYEDLNLWAYWASEE
jgi:hypothetical protein